jgi:hypothetical protein
VEANYQAIQAYAIAIAAAAAEAVQRARDEWFERREQRWEEEEIARREAAEEKARLLEVPQFLPDCAVPGANNRLQRANVILPLGVENEEGYQLHTHA